MFGLGLPEMAVIAVIALIIFGPKRLPEMGKSLGSALREFKKSADSITDEVKSATGADEIAKDITSVKDDFKGMGKTMTEPVSEMTKITDDIKDVGKITGKQEEDEAGAEEAVNDVDKSASEPVSTAKKS